MRQSLATSSIKRQLLFASFPPNYYMLPHGSIAVFSSLSYFGSFTFLHEGLAPCSRFLIESFRFSSPTASKFRTITWESFCFYFFFSKYILMVSSIPSIDRSTRLVYYRRCRLTHVHFLDWRGRLDGMRSCWLSDQKLFYWQKPNSGGLGRRSKVFLVVRFLPRIGSTRHP